MKKLLLAVVCLSSLAFGQADQNNFPGMGVTSLNGSISGTPNFTNVVTSPQTAGAHNYVDGVSNLSIIDAATSTIGVPAPFNAAGFYIETSTPECLGANPFPSNKNISLHLGFGGVASAGVGNWSSMTPWALAQDKIMGWRRGNAATSNGDAGSALYAADGTSQFVCGLDNRFSIKVPYGGSGAGQPGNPTGLDSTSESALLSNPVTGGTMANGVQLFIRIAYLVDLNTAFDHQDTTAWPPRQNTHTYINSQSVTDGTFTQTIVSPNTCLSAGFIPSWNTTVGGKTFDGVCVWKNMGTFVDTFHVLGTTFSAPGWTIPGPEVSITTAAGGAIQSIVVTGPAAPTYQACTTGANFPVQGDLFTANNHIYYTIHGPGAPLASCAAGTFTGSRHGQVNSGNGWFQEVGLAASPTNLPIVAYAVYISTTTGTEKLDNTWCLTPYALGNFVGCKIGTNYVVQNTGSFMSSANHSPSIEDTTAPLIRIGLSANNSSSAGSNPTAVTAFESRVEDLSLEANGMATQAYLLEYGQEGAGGDMVAANGGDETTVSLYGTSGQNSTWHGHSVGNHNSGQCFEQRVASMLVDQSAGGEAVREISNTTFTPYNPCASGGAVTKCIWARGGSSVKLTGTNHFEICTDAVNISAGTTNPNQRMAFSADNLTASGTTVSNGSQLVNVVHATTTAGSVYVQYIETNGAVAVLDDTTGGGATTSGGGGPFILSAADTNGNRYRFWPGTHTFTQARTSPLLLWGHCIGAVNSSVTYFIYPTAQGANAQLCNNVITACASGFCGIPMPEPCTLRHLYVQEGGVAAVVNPITITTRKNGSTTGMPTCNIPAGAAGQSCNDTSSAALFAPGDKLSVSYTSGAAETATDLSWSVTCQ